MAKFHLGSGLVLVYEIKSAQLVQKEPNMCRVFSTGGGIQRGKVGGAWVGLGSFVFILVVFSWVVWGLLLLLLLL